MSIALLTAGVVLAVTGYLGPEDGGLLEAIGLLLIGLAIWKGPSWA